MNVSNASTMPNDAAAALCVDFMVKSHHVPTATGYLADMKVVADYLRLSGWVGLSSTGAVMGRVEGPRKDIDEFLYWMQYATAEKTVVHVIPPCPNKSEETKPYQAFYVIE